MDNEKKKKEKDRRLELLGKKTYPTEWDGLSHEQKTLVKESLAEAEDNKERLKGCKLVHQNQGLSIIAKSDKQEPNGKTLSYGESGEPEIADTSYLHRFENRDDAVRDCVYSKGNLKRLLDEIEFQGFLKRQDQVAIKFANLIMDSKNPKLEMQSILSAAGMELKESGEKTARKFNVTRQAINKKKQSKQKKLGFPEQTRDSKNADAKDIYEDVNFRPIKP